MSRMFLSLLAGCLVAAGVAFSPSAKADDMPSTTTKAATQPAVTCCGDACMKMKDCCKADDKGTVTCSMKGSCCVKADDKKPADKGMGGMDMGK